MLLQLPTVVMMLHKYTTRQDFIIDIFQTVNKQSLNYNIDHAP